MQMVATLNVQSSPVERQAASVSDEDMAELINRYRQRQCDVAMKLEHAIKTGGTEMSTIRWMCDLH